MNSYISENNIFKKVIPINIFAAHIPKGVEILSSLLNRKR